MPTNAEIDQAAEAIVNQWLFEKGYRTSVTMQLYGPTNIEARGTAKYLLIQVKSAIYPSEPGPLSSDETKNLKSLAEKIGYEPREAMVQLDEQLQLVGKIKWRPLME